MAVDIHKLIAAINPDIYCEDFKEEYGEVAPIRDKVKDFLKENPGKYIDASALAEPKKCGMMDFDDKIYYKSPFSGAGTKDPIEKHLLTYDALNENLEPIYFWLLDNLYSEYKDIDVVEKLIDNFASSVGSGHFSEVGQKATRMQEEAMKIMGIANQLVKSILNLLYDLKDFEMLLEQYDIYSNTKDASKKRSAMLYLKQRWMDTVDMKRGNTAIKMLAQQYQYVTIIDAFMVADDVKKVEELDLNDRVKRIIEQRVGEFLIWIKASEKELRKRFDIEKIYLKSQVNTLHLYTQWIKPYIRASKALEQGINFNNTSSTNSAASLVNLFNTALFELVLLGQGKYKPDEDVNKGDLPDIFTKTRGLRKYIPIIIVELKFRSIPERAGQQGYGFRGKVEIAFTSYALRADEIKIFKSELEKDDLGDVLKWIEGSTNESLDKMKEEIDHFLEGKPYETTEPEKEESKQEDTNPISAIFSIFSKPKKKVEDKKNNDGKLEKKDNDLEKVIRNMAIIKARQECRKIYDLFKKTHNMPVF